MGGIVKSIGKAVKKLGKGIGKFLKKYGTTIILAAAVWAGLGAFGAAGSGASIWSPTSVGKGISKIFGFTSRARGASGLPGGPEDLISNNIKAKDFINDTVKSDSLLSGVGKWIGGMKDWQKYTLAQTGLTIAGSLLDKSKEKELELKEKELGAAYGQMGIPYGESVDDPLAIFRENPQWRVPPPPTFTFGQGPATPSNIASAGSSTQGQRSIPGLTGVPRQQQISSQGLTEFDVSSPGMITNRGPGLIGSSLQRRYA